MQKKNKPNQTGGETMTDKYIENFNNVDRVIELLRGSDVRWERTGEQTYTCLMQNVATTGRVLPDERQKEVFRNGSIELQEYGRILDQCGVDKTFVSDYKVTLSHRNTSESSVLEISPIGGGIIFSYGESNNSYPAEAASLQQKVRALYQAVDRKLSGS